jgi:hypothetical protein
VEVVAQLDRYPGICAVSGTSEGRFVRTDLFCHVNAGDEVFLSEEVVASAAAALGWMSPVAVLEAGGLTLELREAKAALEELRDEHTMLLDRVGFTLQRGAVVRGNAVHLRIPPWERGKRRGTRKAISSRPKEKV